MSQAARVAPEATRSDLVITEGEGAAAGREAVVAGVSTAVMCVPPSC
jgi:hypothetical protein